MDNEQLTQLVAQQKGELIYLQCMVNSILRAVPPQLFSEILSEFEQESEGARTAFLPSSIPEAILQSFETQISIMKKRLSP